MSEYNPNATDLNYEEFDSEALSNMISDEVEFSGYVDKFNYQLNFMESKREYTKVRYKDEFIYVVPLAATKKEGKYVFKKKGTNEVFSANVSDFSDK